MTTKFYQINANAFHDHPNEENFCRIAIHIKKFRTEKNAKRRNVREKQTFITRAWHKKVCKFYTVDKTFSLWVRRAKDKVLDE